MRPPHTPAWRSTFQRFFTSALERPSGGSSSSSSSSSSLSWRTPAPSRASTRTTPLHGGAPRPRSGSILFAPRLAPRRGFRFSAWRRSGGSGEGPAGKKAAEESLSLSARLRKLSKEYGWAAVGVYLGLSVLDFPFCFLLVRIVGTERIGQIEHYVVSGVSRVVPESVRARVGDAWHAVRGTRSKAQLEDGEAAGWGVEEARERNQEEASLATQLALAYAIHKSFIFLRVPLTAAVTPKVVKVLRSWGWNIGRKTPR